MGPPLATCDFLTGEVTGSNVRQAIEMAAPQVGMVFDLTFGGL